MKRKVYFRADASADIGYGHFVRTLALADMLKDNFDCTFFTQTPTEYQKVEIAKVCKLVELPADESKFKLFLECLEGNEIVVIDNYFFSTDYQCLIKARGCRLVCIDDIHDKHYVADVVINHAVGDDALFSVEPYTKLCLGLEWALLRKPFLKPCKLKVREKNHWFIAFGGSDYYNLTEKFVRLIHNYEYVYQISAVIGDAYKYESSLTEYSKLHIYKNLTSEEMATLMQRCEYAILPCSGICIEAISQGCKVYAGYYVDNQVTPYSYLAANNLIYGIGDLNSIKSFDPQSHHLRERIEQIDFCSISSKYSEIFNSLEESYVYNNLAFVDYTLLPEINHKYILESRNNDSVRVYMDSPNVINWDNHCNFVSMLKTNTQRRYWAVYNEGILVGSVNISYVDDSTVERGIFITPSQFGKNWGTKIEIALSEMLRGMGISIVNAKVMHTNERSLLFHYKNEYVKIGSDDKYEYLIKRL